MAKGRCCGEPSLPTVLSDITLIDPVIYNPTFHNTKFMPDCKGNMITEKTPVATCQDLADLVIISEDEDNVIRPGTDGGAFVGISDDPRNVTVLDEDGDILTPISADAGNKVVKGTDGGILVTWDESVVTALVGCDNQPHAAGTTIPSCAQMNDAINNHEGPDPVTRINNCAGNPHAAGTTIPSCADLDAAINNLATNITSHIVGCDGQPHASGTPMPSCAQMQAAIDAGGGGGSGPLAVKAFPLTSVGPTLTVRVFGPVGFEFFFSGSGLDGTRQPPNSNLTIGAQGYADYSAGLEPNPSGGQNNGVVLLNDAATNTAYDGFTVTLAQV